MIPTDDKILIEHIRQGDQKALESLYEKYYYSLCDFSLNFLKSPALAEEVVSDVFLSIWLKRETLEITSNLKSYLFVSVRNQSFNYSTQNKRLHEDLSVADALQHPASAEADSGIRYTELSHEIDAILEKLPELRRTIFKLNRIEGLKYKEIAEILSISVNTVQKQMILAVKFISQFHPSLKEIYAPCLPLLLLLLR